MTDIAAKTIEEKTDTHPCFNCGAGKNARIHLPIAPKCNIQCNYCVRKYDCPNESRPGVTTDVLNPQEAFEKYRTVKEKIDNLTVVGIAGPGDALANFEETKETLKLIRSFDPDITFCLSTNGLMLPHYAQELIDLGVSHVTVTINAVDAEIGAKIYKYVDYMGTRYTGKAAAQILLKNQLEGLKYLVERSIVCKINIVVIKGVNEHHIPEVVKKVKEIGAYITNIMQLIPVKGSGFENLELVTNKEIMRIRKECESHMKQMYHCRQCRADAIGTLDNDLSLEFSRCKSCSKESAYTKPIKIAVASKNGTLVDQHFGHAEELYIYEYSENIVNLLEKRKVAQYCSGEENCGENESSIDTIMTAVSDCDCVMAMRIGNTPEKMLQGKGIKVITTFDKIDAAIHSIAQG